MTLCLCFFQQKTAYEMRISDWSSYVCSSDLTGLLLDLTRRFGRLVPHILTQYHHPDTPEISVIRSNIVGDAKSRVTQKPAGAYWHSDLSYDASPSDCTFLYSVDVPARGGDTCFANMYQIGRGSCRERVCQYV